MIDTLTDTLMALWNTTWRGKILPGLIAFIVVGICMSLFFLLIKLPAFSHQQPTTLNRSEKSANLAISPHNGDIHATVVPTPTPAPTPMQTSDVPVPAPLPIQLPGITSDPNVASAINTDIGNTDINSYTPAPAPTNATAQTSIRHMQPTAKPISAPPVIPTATPTPPVATATAIPTHNTPPSTTSVTPTSVPTSIIVATPTANPAPTPTYPATSTSGSSPTASATAILAPAVTAMPTANTSNITVTAVTKNSPA